MTISITKVTTNLGIEYTSVSRDEDHPATEISNLGVISKNINSNTARLANYYNTSGLNLLSTTLLEPERTNYILNSYFSLDLNFDSLGDYWTKVYGTATRETCSINNITDGKSQKISHTFLGTEADYATALQQNTANSSFDVSAGAINVTLSFYARGNLAGIVTGTGVTRFLHWYGETDAGVYVELLPIKTIDNILADGLSATAWKRFVYSGTLTNANTRKIFLSFMALRTSDKPGAGENMWFEVYGVQIEKASTVSSFIPTISSALTRNAETLATVPSSIETEMFKTTNKPYYQIILNIYDESTGTYESDIDITSYLTEIPSVDRQIQTTVESDSTLKVSDAVFTLSNQTKLFSPDYSGSIFYGKDYLDSKITVYAGFIVSDTEAQVTSQMVVYAEELILNILDKTVQLTCKGLGRLLERVNVGSPDQYGGANPLVYSGSQKFKTIVEDLLSTYGKIPSTSYSVDDLDHTYTNLTFTDISLITALGQICQSAGASIYEDRFGKIKVSIVKPIYGGTTLTATSIKDSDYLYDIQATNSIKNLISKINVTGPGTIFHSLTNTVTSKGKTEDIYNPCLQTNADAQNLASVMMGKYGTTLSLLEITCAYFPSLDLDSLVYLTETNLNIVDAEYKICKYILNLSNFSLTLGLIKSDILSLNYAFLGDRTIENASYDAASDADKRCAYLGDRDLPTTQPLYYLYRR